MDKRISEEVPADPLGDEFKGYVLKITGGFDKQGFAMKQGVLLNHRTRLLLDGNSGHYYPSRHGERRRKSVRGCITGPDLSVVNLVITKRGPADLPKLTTPESNKPSIRGPKRASNIRKLWGLAKEDDVRRFVPKRKIAGKDGKKDKFKSPKIQRLVTPVRLQRKRRALALKKRRFEKNKTQAAEYATTLNQLRSAKRAELISKKRERASERKSVKAATPAAPAAKSEKKDKKTATTAAPAKQAPKKDAPAKQAPKAAAPKKDAPAKQAPKAAAPKKDAAPAKPAAPKKDAAPAKEQKKAPAKKEAAPKKEQKK